MAIVRHLEGILQQNSVNFGENFHKIHQTAKISAQQRCHAARVFVTLELPRGGFLPVTVWVSDREQLTVDSWQVFFFILSVFFLLHLVCIFMISVLQTTHAKRFSFSLMQRVFHNFFFNPLFYTSFYFRGCITLHFTSLYFIARICTSIYGKLKTALIKKETVAIPVQDVWRIPILWQLMAVILKHFYDLYDKVKKEIISRVIDSLLVN